MSTTGLAVFDETVQLTNTWLKELMQDLGWEDRQRAYLGLRLTLQSRARPSFGRRGGTAQRPTAHVDSGLLFRGMASGTQTAQGT